MRRHRSIVLLLTLGISKLKDIVGFQMPRLIPYPQVALP